MFNILRKKSPSEFKLKDIRFTPDAVQLEQRQLHRLFVPDELAEGMSDHHRVDGLSLTLASAYTRDKFIMYKHEKVVEEIGEPKTKVIGVPLLDNRSHSEKQKVQLPGDRNFMAKVRGQLMAVFPKVLFELDIYRENTVQFNRKRVHVCIPYYEQGVNRDGKEFMTGEKVFIIEAWMYVGSREYWEPFIDNGFYFKKAGIFPSERRWLKEYYDFTYKGYHI